MRYRRSITAMTICAAFVVGAVFAPTAAAQTGAGAAAPPLTEQVVPPSCVVAENDRATFTSPRGTVRVTNTCTRIERVKVLIAFGGDSECFVRQAGGEALHTYFFPSRFDGLVRC